MKIPLGVPFVVGPGMGKAATRGYLTPGWGVKTVEFNHPVIVGPHVYHARTKKAARQFALLMGGRG